MILVLMLVITAGFPVPTTSGPVIKIDNGKIRGLKLRNVFNRIFYAFLDIPYAAPPVGNLRFQKPQSANNWNGVLNTTQNRKTCWEVPLLHKKKINKPDEDEDCLYLNVYTPQLFNSKKLLPVLVYIYGGNFGTGHAWFEDFDPQILVDKGIVAVSFNFRSGPFGFLSTEDDVFPKNLGLKDQRFALQWIQKNIRYFGGDASKVTLMGHSSGSMSIGFHLLNNNAEGLFRSVIMQSGAVLTPSSTRKHARYYAYQLGKQLSPNFTNKNSSLDLFNLLKNAPASDIYHAKLPFFPGTTFLGEIMTGYWSPVIEDPEDEDAIVTGPMYEDLLNGNFLKVPAIMGITSEEFLFYINPLRIRDWAPHADSPDALVKEDSDIMKERSFEFSRRLKRIYTNTTFQENIGSLIRYLSDAQFRVPSVGQAELQSKFSDVYFYQFSYFGEKNFFKGFEHPVNIPGLGNAGHVEDRNYLMLRGPNRWRNFWQHSASELLTQNRMVKLWTNFIKYMNPTPRKDPLLQNVIWPTIKSKKYNFTFLNVDEDLTVNHEYPREYGKWKPLIEEYYQHPISFL